jgi:hypothetical protein
MKPSFAALAVALLLAAPIEAKVQSKEITGCVRARQNGGYQLLSKSKKGKSREFDLVGTYDFSKNVGHTIRVDGVRRQRRITVSAVHEVANSCK